MMSTNSEALIQASAPATLMLTGEHAVLHGYPALVAALDQRLTVSLTPRKDTLFTIQSDLGHYEGNIHNISIAAPFQFITTILKNYQHKLVTGFDLKVQSDFSHQVGLGSSAAITVATVKVISKWLGDLLSPEDVFNQSYAVIQEIQKVGSGADVAASVWGGIQFYQQPFSYTPLPSSSLPPVSVVYTGSKKPTVEVINLVEKNYKQDPDQYEDYFRTLGEYTLNAQFLIEKKDWKKLGEIFNFHYEIQKLMQLSTPLIDHLIQKMRSTPGIYGAKISGSGLGDCIIGIGTSDQNMESQLQVKIDSRGADYE